MEFVQVVSVENMRKSDARTIAEHTPSAELMYRAAQGIFNSAKFVGKVAIVCGKGNNGGDGLVAARRLQDAGVEVIAVLAEGEPATPDAAANREAAQDRGVHIQTLDGLTLRDEVFIARADALVDAVYGTGFHGALRPAGQRAAAMLNSGRFVLALDVPSGVCADTGETAEGAVRAHVTVAFHAPKPCHRLAAEQCGTVVTADIGIGAALGEG